MITEEKCIIAYETLTRQLGMIRPCVLVLDLKSFACVVPLLPALKYQYHYMIFITPGFSKLHRLFVLAHEMGHIFNYPSSKCLFPGKFILGELTKRKRMHSEDHANEYACRVCSALLGSSIRTKYNKFYKNICTKTKLLKDA